MKSQYAKNVSIFLFHCSVRQGTADGSSSSVSLAQLRAPYPSRVWGLGLGFLDFKSSRSESGGGHGGLVSPPLPDPLAWGFLEVWIQSPLRR